MHVEDAIRVPASDGHRIGADARGVSDIVAEPDSPVQLSDLRVGDLRRGPVLVSRAVVVNAHLEVVQANLSSMSGSIAGSGEAMIRVRPAARAYSKACWTSSAVFMVITPPP